MTRGTRLFVGCLVLPVLLIGLALLLLAVAFVLPTPEPQRARRTFDHALVTTPTVSLATAEPTAVQAVRVRVEFEEGALIIAPGEIGSSVRVDADLDEAIYKLDVDSPVDAPAGSYDIQLHRVGSAIGLIRRLRSKSSTENRLRVELPRGIPMELSVRMRRGEMQVDLTGLTIRTLRLDHQMGDGAVVFNEPSPIPLEQLEVRARMGDLKLTGLGYAGAQHTIVNARMGSYTLDFGGAVDLAATVKLNLRMGDARIIVPEGMTTHVERQEVRLGEFESEQSSAVETEELHTAGTLGVDVNLMMGEVTVGRGGVAHQR